MNRRVRVFQAVVRVILITIVSVVISGLFLLVPAIDVAKWRYIAAARLAEYQVVIEEIQAKKDTGPNGTKYIVPLWNGKVAFAGRVMTALELYRDYEWGQ